MKIKDKSGNAKAPPAWQVKGVEPETREAVKQAARRKGMTIDEAERWLGPILAYEPRELSQAA